MLDSDAVLETVIIHQTYWLRWVLSHWKVGHICTSDFFWNICLYYFYFDAYSFNSLQIFVRMLLLLREYSNLIKINTTTEAAPWGGHAFECFALTLAWNQSRTRLTHGLSDCSLKTSRYLWANCSAHPWRSSRGFGSFRLLVKSLVLICWEWKIMYHGL